MKKLGVLLVLLLLIGMLAFVGCKKEESAEGQGTEAETEEMAESKSPEDYPFNIVPPDSATTIDVIGWAFPITEFYSKEFGKLNEVENLEVNTQLLASSDAQEQVRLALSGGQKSPYEIVHAANTQIAECGHPGWLMPLNDLVDKYWDEYNLGDIPEKSWEAATVNGEIVGVPAVANGFQLIYRKDLFDKYDIDVPTTFDECIAAAQKLKDDPELEVPFCINLHAGWAWEIEFFQMLRSFGGDYFNDDNTAAFNGPEGVAALEKILEVADKAIGEVGMSYSVDDLEIGLQTGRLGFANTWASRAVSMKNPEKSAYAEELEFAPSPAGKAGAPLVASAWNDFYCIPKKAEVDAELIFKVIMETIDLESQLEAVEVGIPTRSEALKSDKAGAYMPAVAVGLEEGIGSYPNNQGLGLIRTALGQYLPLVGTGELSPQEALDKAAEQYEEEARANGFIE